MADPDSQVPRVWSCRLQYRLSVPVSSYLRITMTTNIVAAPQAHIIFKQSVKSATDHKHWMYGAARSEHEPHTCGAGRATNTRQVGSAPLPPFTARVWAAYRLHVPLWRVAQQSRPSSTIFIFLLRCVVDSVTLVGATMRPIYVVCLAHAVVAGEWFEGVGDTAYIKALDTAYRTYTADPEFQV